MVPPFDLQGGVELAVLRASAVGALLSVFGALVFRLWVAPRAMAVMPRNVAHIVRRRLLLVSRISAAAGILALLGWLVLQAGIMADADTAGQALEAVPAVLGNTVFGHVLAAQLALLIILGATLVGRDHPVRQRAGLAVAVVALALQAGHSHAYSMYGGASLLLGADVLHLLGAGAWLGGLLPLLLTVQAAPPNAGATAARWFSPLGQWCIAAIVVSAAYQFWVLVGSVPGLVGTAYGWLLLGKLALFGVLLGFAAANRYRFAPALLHGDARAAKQVLLRSLILQTGFAAGIIVAAALLSALPPSMHEQALWPFADRFSLDAINEDADFKREVVVAAAALAVASGLLVVACVLRRLRWVAAAVAVVVAWFAVPHFDLLLVPAYPSSFYHSPTGFAAGTIEDGSRIYAGNCIACHGAGGRGDGPTAHNLPVPPADLTAAHLWMHSDGELFWWLSHGINTPEGAQAMPGFAGVLDEDQIWAVIDFIRARNAGTARHDRVPFPPPVQAPGFGMMCGTATVKLADLRGRYVRLVVGPGPAGPPVAYVTSVMASPAASAPPGICTTDDETVAKAYAIVSGLGEAQMPGSQFLIDDQGWLRAFQPPGSAQDWRNAAVLQAEIGKLRAEPAAAAPQPMPMNMPM